MDDYVKRFVTKDGKQRVTIYRDDYADNPRYNTDEPLHCEDWSRECTIMVKSERESHSSSARNLLEYLINNYGDEKKIIESLVTNGKNPEKLYDVIEKKKVGTLFVAKEID